MSAPAISPFVWADYFETGFDDVDGQHHKLVDFINALAGRAISGVPIRPDEVSHSLDRLIGAGLGLGRIGGQVAESIARQPEAAGDIRGAGLLIAVLLEGATIIALVFALLFKLIK